MSQSDRYARYHCDSNADFNGLLEPDTGIVYLV
jgi:hypothetical protein